jgi:S1-C subfamily serine protease
MRSGKRSNAAPDAAAKATRSSIGSAQQTVAAPATPPADPPAPPLGRLARLRRLTAGLSARYERFLLVALGMAAALAVVAVSQRMAPAAPGLDQKIIDAAVLRTLETATLPSPAARAWEIIRPSVVRVRRIGPPKEGKDGQSGSEGEDIGVGSGVVIVESGLILTNLHVVEGATSIKVVFADGLVSDADIVQRQPDQDLAVLKARTLPDDLQAATLKSTADLRPGDTVIAAGFPFGIGPSVTSGVVSGLKREFRTPQGQQLLTNLIQFDAAVNPGSSGGPLITPEGEVVGIVTAVLNPTEQRVFVGIGFAVPIENAAGGAGMSPF